MGRLVAPHPFRDRRGSPVHTFATFKTSLGDIRVLLMPDHAPKTVENFVGLATGGKEWTDPGSGKKRTDPLYSGTVFHRVIPNFMIQGGDPMGSGFGGPGYQFEDEFTGGPAFDKPGLLAMANAGPNTNGSQFFITEVATPHLNNRHTIFGKVVSGFEIVQQIAHVPTSNDKPKEPVVLSSVEISEEE